MMAQTQEWDVCCSIFCHRAGIWNLYEQPAGSYMPRHPDQVVTCLIVHCISLHACFLSRILRMRFTCWATHVKWWLWAALEPSPGLCWSVMFYGLRLILHVCYGRKPTVLIGTDAFLARCLRYLSQHPLLKQELLA